MPRRTSWIERPGVDGVVTDVPAHQLPSRNLARGADAIVPNGLVRQRRGWAYDGTTADVVDNLVAVARAKFVLAGATRTVTVDDDGDLFLHNAAAVGTSIYAGTVVYLPRCVYNDEVIWCAQDGQTPLRRYAGVASAGAYTAADATYTAGEATLTTTGAPNFDNAEVGMFFYGRTFTTPSIGIVYKVVEVGTDILTVEEMQASATQIVVGEAASPTGTTYPCVSVYSAGTLSATSAGPSVVTGQGTKWSAGGWGSVNPEDVSALHSDSVSVQLDSGSYTNVLISDLTDDDTMAFSKCETITTAPYQVLRRCPFKDSAAHKGSFWGTGVDQHKSRVFVGPVGWNLSYPPGFTPPFNPTTGHTSDNPLDFLMDFVDVPAPNDADECVALIPSTNPLVVPKRNDAYGVFGQHGALDVSMLPGGEGAGCMDIRSAHSLSIGPVWAGPNGVFCYYGGQVRSMTRGRIEREWQDLAADFDFGTADYCTIGEKDDCMVVHLTTAGGTIQRTWHLYPFADDGKWGPRWFDRVSNFAPRYMFSSKIQGEDDTLLAVQDADQGRVINYAPAIDGTGIARDGDGTSPALELHMSSRLARDAGANVDERLLELVVEANITDSGGTSSTLGGSVVSTQGLDSTATVTTTLGSMASKTADGPKPYVHRVGVKAGLHQLRLAKSATQTTETVTEISRVGVTVRASKRPL